MKKTKKICLALVAILILVATGILYNVYDNQRFIVEEQTVTLSNLPESFNGYKILQISDLHGKSFGESQDKLLSVINELDYDAILFTGDMNKYESSDVASSEAVIDLINGIKSKDTALWVDGNTGPFAIEKINGSGTGRLTAMGETIEQSGVKVLTTPVQISKNGANIWFVPELSWSDIQMNYLYVTADSFDTSNDFQNVISHGKSLQEWYAKLNKNEEIKIRVDHYPIQANIQKSDWDTLGFIDYDLSIAGHYHGGQIRFPFIGALYIPSPTSGIKNGYFPKQSEVKGLNQILDMQQYVSAGLGASASISFLDFRLFNSPEINLITLRCQK